MLISLSLSFGLFPMSQGAITQSFMTSKSKSMIRVNAFPSSSECDCVSDAEMFGDSEFRHDFEHDG